MDYATHSSGTSNSSTSSSSSKNIGADLQNEEHMNSYIAETYCAMACQEQRLKTRCRRGSTKAQGKAITHYAAQLIETTIPKILDELSHDLAEGTEYGAEEQQYLVTAASGQVDGALTALSNLVEAAPKNAICLGTRPVCTRF